MSQAQETSAAASPSTSQQSPPDLNKAFFRFSDSMANLGKIAFKVGKEHVLKTAAELKVEAQVAFHDAQEEATAIFKEVIGGAETLYKDVKSDAQAAVRGALDSIAVHPDEQKGAVDQIVRALPGIGPTTQYADAWKLWHNGVLTNDETKKDQARADCISAIGGAGIDITLLGSKIFCGVAKATRHVLSPLIGAKTASALGTEGDLFTTLAKNISKTEPAKSIAEFLLESVAPTAQKSDLDLRTAKIEKKLDEIVDQFAETDQSAGAGEKT
jgi:hypothetical protein